MKKKDITIRSSAAEYLTYVAAVGDQPDAIEIRYEDENVWLTQKMMAQLYDVDVRTINEHISHVFNDGELDQEATIRNFRIVQMEGSRNVSREVLMDAGKVTAELAKAHAEAEFEKYRIVQDRLYLSDFDKFLLLEEEAQKFK